MTKSHNMNLYSPDESSLVNIAVANSAATFHGDVPIQFNSRVDLTNSSGVVVHQDLTAKLTLMQSDITAAAATGTAAASQVQTNLDTYIASNNIAVAANTAAITTETAQRQAAVTATTTTLTNLITAEETARLAADATLTTDLATEVTDRTTAVAAEATARAAAVTTLTGLINTEKTRIDGILSGSTVNLDSLAELVSAYESADSSLLTTITNIQTQLTALQAVVDTLTDESP